MAMAMAAMAAMAMAASASVAGGGLRRVAGAARRRGCWPLTVVAGMERTWAHCVTWVRTMGVPQVRSEVPKGSNTNEVATARGLEAASPKWGVAEDGDVG